MFLTFFCFFFLHFTYLFSAFIRPFLHLPSHPRYLLRICNFTQFHSDQLQSIPKCLSHHHPIFPPIYISQNCQSLNLSQWRTGFQSNIHIFINFFPFFNNVEQPNEPYECVAWMFIYLICSCLYFVWFWIDSTTLISYIICLCFV